MDALLRVEGLTTRFHTPGGLVHAVRSVCFEVGEGEIVGLVGESGCGKSATALSLLRLLPEPPARIENGRALFAGRDLLRLDAEDLRAVRGREIALITQQAMSALNPVLTIGAQLTEVLRLHLGMEPRPARERATELLASVGIARPAERLAEHPHRLSGGMRQRVMIAMALAGDPRLLIADEPTTALDVTLQAEILDLIEREQRRRGMAVLWISHDLGVVARLASRVLVMYAGRIVEEAPADRLFSAPRHPYTLALLAAQPRAGLAAAAPLPTLPGRPPDLVDPPAGCAFAPRCRFVVEGCAVRDPALEPVATAHRVACWETDRVAGAPA